MYLKSLSLAARSCEITCQVVTSVCVTHAVIMVPSFADKSICLINVFNDRVNGPGSFFQSNLISPELQLLMYNIQKYFFCNFFLVCFYLFILMRYKI